MNDNISAGEQPSQVPLTAPVDSRQAAAPADIRLPVRPRFWPALLAIIVMWIIYKGTARVFPGTYLAQLSIMLGPPVGFLGFLISWIFFSRIPWRDRWLFLLACALACGLVYPLCDKSIDPLVLGVYAPPIVLTAWVLWLVATPFLSWPVRRIGLGFVIMLVWGYFPLLVWHQVDGSFTGQTTWRFLLTDEDKFLAENTSRESHTAPPLSDEKLQIQPGDWPGFRGANRDGRLLGVSIDANWEKSPPKELWRKRVGPGWSSCVVIGKRLYTQEQIKGNEAVVCYDTDNKGEILWTHLTPGRFYEALGGLGPRATPTFHDGKIYALAATGSLICLDAATGKEIWQRNIREDADAKLPQWGFSSSPLVMDGIVTVYAGGPNDKMLLGYDALTGDLKWSAGNGKNSYCSPQPARLGGAEQIVMCSAAGLASFKPDGKFLWQFEWDVGDTARAVQPAIVDEQTVLIGTGFNFGLQKVKVKHEGDTWEASAVWPEPTRDIKPYFNDLVVHKGHAYGYDGNLFTCVELENGKRKWKERGGYDKEAFGNGQVLLLAEQELLLIITEKGNICLVDAKPKYRLLPGRFQAIEGTTWNHPVIANGRLFVRNAAEIACYELAGYRMTMESAGK